MHVVGTEKAGMGQKRCLSPFSFRESELFTYSRSLYIPMTLSHTPKDSRENLLI